MRGLSDDRINPLLPKGPPPGAKIILVLAVSLGLMFVDEAHHTLDPVRSTLATIIQPLRAAAQLPAQTIRFIGDYFDRDDAIAENRSLKRENLILHGRLQKLAALQAENERIRGLLASARSMRDHVLIAEILAAAPGPYRHYVELNKGSLDGVFVGQALVDSNGIMGQVTRVTPMWATAILITDPNNAIPVEINRTGLQTIVQGTGKTKQLSLPFLPANTDVRKGDLLVSSGLGGRYPSGYPVARIVSVSQHAGHGFLTVTAAPTAKLDRGREILLVWDKPPGKKIGAAGADDANQPTPATNVVQPPAATAGGQ